MIDAIGKENLCNKIAGSYRGIFETYRRISCGKCRDLGLILLHKAYLMLRESNKKVERLGLRFINLYDEPDEPLYRPLHRAEE